ncbi:MAG: UDP-3-O-acyl-N-acetylglucosamine deacetylase, partial [Flavobacteriia bacterium]|nr:UDP-3-O-acyl-N-acetylglucosamine deacetylase [Flavobacteriia bacterium]
VYTTEHDLAALYGMEVDNALIKIDGPEIPIMDGSSLPFVKEIIRVGYQEQEATRDYFILDENVKWEDTEKGIEFLAVPDNGYRITVMVDYNSPALGTQHAAIYNIDAFEKEIAPCRTFCFLRELEFLASNNLIKGGDLDNAIVLVERNDVSQEELNRLAKLLGKENLTVNYDGIGVLNSLKLQFENEPARHKLLDIVGDLALVGKPIKAHILGARPGHSGNVRFAKVLKEQIKKQEKAGRKFDVTAEIKPADVHLIDGPIAPADESCRVRILLVAGRVVIVGGHVKDGALRERRRVLVRIGDLPGPHEARYVAYLYKMLAHFLYLQMNKKKKIRSLSRSSES